jgi:sugar lactone lactonase YvrE
MKEHAAKSYRALQAELGEGPVWHDDALWCVDINAGRLHRLDADKTRDRSWKIGDSLGAAVPATDGRWLAVRRHDLAWFNPADGSVTAWATPPEQPPFPWRFNDAKCDPAGRLWVGNLDNEHRRPGCALYCFEGPGAFHRRLDGVTLSNGLGWSPDGSRAYYVDTTTRQVDVFNFDLARGTLSERRPLTTFTEREGYPDGLTIDVEGHLWLAMFGGSGVLRLHHTTGERLARVRLPVSQATSCTFGGPGLGQLFITSAAENFTAVDRSREPAAGDIFVCEPGVAGRPVDCFRPRGAA